MGRLLCAALALALLICFCACAAPQEEEPIPPATMAETTAEMTTAAGYEENSEPLIFGIQKMSLEITERFQPLLDHEGIVPDEDIRGFINFLEHLCDSIWAEYQPEDFHPLVMLSVSGSGYRQPDYRAMAKALEGKLSPGTARWLELYAEDLAYEPLDYTCNHPEHTPWQGIPPEHYIHMAKAWYAFELEYPELAHAPGAWQSRLSASWAHGYLTPGSDFPLSEESEAAYDARQKASMAEFLGGKANTKYPFYAEIQADYNERFN